MRARVTLRHTAVGHTAVGHTAVGHTAVALLLALCATALPAKTAQTAPVNPALDVWVATRYRGAHLLVDTATTVPAMAAAALAPRVEAVRRGTRVDTLWAIHFSAQGQGPTLAVPSSVRLAGPTGTITTLTARLVSRRPFRAPRVPGTGPSDTTRPAAWRQGWAYLALLPHDDTRNASRYRGWLLLGAPEPPVPASSRTRLRTRLRPRSR